MKPGDFFVGVLDFFAALLPGAIATWLVLAYVDPGDLSRGNVAFGGDVGGGFAYLLASYILGHFAYAIGARLDGTYDNWRKRHYPDDFAYAAAAALRKNVSPRLGPSEGKRAMSTLKWARAYVLINAAAARTEIDLLEANSKFFRTLVVVFAFACAHFLLYEQRLELALAAAAAVVLSYERYCDQRWKSTQQTFLTAVVVNAPAPNPKLLEPDPH